MIKFNVLRKVTVILQLLQECENMVRKLPISLLNGSADSSGTSTCRDDQSSASSPTTTNRHQNTGHHAAAASSHILVEDESTGVPPIGTHHKGSSHVYMTHKILKLREIQRQPHLDQTKSSIFKSCIMFINGYTNPPIEELRRLIHQHGGETIAYRAIKITHYVCNNFTDAQLKAEYSKIRLNVQSRVHNVTSAWILESIKHMKRLDENLYSPQGLSFQHGRDISTMLSSSNSAKPKVKHSSEDRGTSSSTNHNVELDVIDASTQHSDAKSSDSPVAYTSSQEAFVSAIPLDMRKEVTAQLKEINKRKATNSSIAHAGKHMRHGAGCSIGDGIAFRDEDEDDPTLRSDVHDRLVQNNHHRSSSAAAQGMIDHHPSLSSSNMINHHRSSSSGTVNHHPSSLLGTVNHELDVIDALTQHSDVQSSDSPVAYTSSQEAFVSAIPLDMRTEVTAQLKEINKRKATNSSIVHAGKHMRHVADCSIRDGIAFRDEYEDDPTLRSDVHDRLVQNHHHRSSSSSAAQGMIDHHPSSSSIGIVNHHPNSSSSGIINHHRSLSSGVVNHHPSSSSSSSSGTVNHDRKNNLESMIACVHFSDGRYNSSKSIGAKMRQYVDALLALDSSSKSNSIGMDDSSPHVVKSNSTPSKATVALLEDYAQWLVLSDQLEQVRRMHIHSYIV